MPRLQNLPAALQKSRNHWNQALHLCLGAGSLTLKSLLQAASDVELSPKSPSSERYHALPARNCQTQHRATNFDHTSMSTFFLWICNY